MYLNKLTSRTSNNYWETYKIGHISKTVIHIHIHTIYKT